MNNLQRKMNKIINNIHTLEPKELALIKMK